MARKGRIVLIVLIVVLSAAVVLLAGAFLTARSPTDAPSHVRFLSIEGDVENCLTMNTGTPTKNENAAPGDADFEGVPLTEFVSGAGLSGTPKEIWIRSSADGFTVKIAWEGAEKAFMVFSAESGWRVVAPSHPLPVNATAIDALIVVSEGSEVGLRVARQDGNAEVVPFGKILTSPLLSSYRLDGTAKIGDENPLWAEVYTRQDSFALSDMYDGAAFGGFVVVTKNGDKYLTDGAGRFVVYRQTLAYVETTGDVYENVAEIRLR